MHANKVSTGIVHANNANDAIDLLIEHENKANDANDPLIEHENKA